MNINEGIEYDRKNMIPKPEPDYYDPLVDFVPYGRPWFAFEDGWEDGEWIDDTGLPEIEPPYYPLPDTPQ